MNSETQIVERARQGDRVAYGELVARYRPLVFGLCRSMTGSGADAEDLTHDAFIEAFLKLDSLRDTARFLPWLRTLTLNLCRMWHRRERRVLEGVPDAEEAHEESEMLVARLTGEMAQLPMPQQAALLLQYWEGLSYEEIAAFLDVPVGTVMSRLHRAKRGLRSRIERMDEDEEEVPMVSEEEFQAALNAEIDLLLELVETKESRERLSVLLGRSPERLAQFLLSVTPAQVDHLARLLKRPNNELLDLALALCFDPEQEMRSRARLLLRRLICRGPERPRTGKHWELPLRAEATRLLDRLIASDLDVKERCDLLIDLMEGADEDATEHLLVSVLLCWPDEAFPLLLARWRSGGERESWLERALCRTGDRLLDELLEELASGEETRIVEAIALLDRFVDRFDRKWMQGVSPMHRALEIRARGVLFRDQLDPGLIRRVIDAVVNRAQAPTGEVAASTIRVVAGLGGAEFLPVLRTGLGHAAPPARLAAVQAVRELNDVESGAALLERIGDRDSSVHRAAIQALGALRVEGALGLLVELTRDEDRETAKCAVTALGAFGEDRSQNLLKELVASGDPHLARAAASALYGGRRPKGTPSALTRERLQRVRGDAAPPLHISPVAAIRELPEPREYEERELTHLIAQVCSDYSATRRYLVMDTSVSLMARDRGTYRLTGIGMAVWRVERFIRERYLGSR